MALPYEQTFIYEGYARPEMAFMASLPAFKAIGRLSGAVWRAHLRSDDPSRPWRELVAQQPNDPIDVPAAGNSDNHNGLCRVECCGVIQLTEHQKRLFDWLEVNQNAVVEQTKPAIARLFDQTIQWRSSSDVREQILFPADVTYNEKLDRFEVNHLELDRNGHFLWIELESMDGWFLEHGCCVVLKDGKLWCAGSWDDIEAAHHSNGLDSAYFA
jgi:hypothetical protein